MKRNVFYTLVCYLFILLMFIGFFLPFLVFEDPNSTYSQSIRDRNVETIPLILLLFGSYPLTFFTYDRTKQREKGQNFFLLGFALVSAIIALIFLIRGITEAGDYEVYTYTLSYSPFYMIFITLLFGLFYWQRDTVFRYIDRNYRKAKKSSQQETK
ncbi:MAG: hypothetical protein ACLFTZ_03975 [Acholeplasmataceae bacterium]